MSELKLSRLEDGEGCSAGTWLIAGIPGLVLVQDIRKRGWLVAYHSPEESRSREDLRTILRWQAHNQIYSSHQLFPTRTAALLWVESQTAKPGRDLSEALCS